MMFDSFEAYDVQETRRISRAEGEVRGILHFFGNILGLSWKLVDK